MDLLLHPQSIQGANLFLGKTQANKWIDNLPNVLNQLLDEWQLKFIRSIPSGTRGLIVLCENDHDQIVIKIPFDITELQSESEALIQWRKSETNHMVKLYAYNIGALATIYVPGNPLNREKTDVPFQNVVNAFKDIHKEAPIQHHLPSIYKNVEQRLLKSKYRMNKIKSPLTHAQVDKAIARVNELSSNNFNQLVHGDCHSGNMINSNQQIIFCDPKGAIGDPHYDCAMWALKADNTTCLDEWIKEFENVGYSKDLITAWIPIIALHESVSYLYHQKSLERLTAFKFWTDKLA